ncbi:unnamed protein product [Lupinus luteus]|uniref:DEK-C domain-containing protein n=1 Tax=Lupinus luteus TaxID=3873 RepID=A0AAV1X2J0_LUPLU
MGEEESVNVVSNTASNGNSLLGKTLNDVSEKYLEADQGKTLGGDGVKDLKKDGIKEIEEDKKAGGEEEVEGNKKVDGGEEVKDDKEVYYVDGKEEGKKDVNASENETEVKETVDSKEDNENVEAKKPGLDVSDPVGIYKGKDESSEKGKIQEEEKDEDKVDKPKEEEKIEDSGIEKGLKKFGKGKNIRERVKNKRRETVDSKGEKENIEANKSEVGVMEEVSVLKYKDETSEKKKIQDEKDDDKINISKGEENVDDSKVEKGLTKRGKGKINVENLKRKRKETVNSKRESVEAKKPELDSMEEEGVSKDKDDSSEKEKVKEEKEEDGKKASKKCGKGKIYGEKVGKKRKELPETEPRTPVISRPVRERKTVERLVALIENDANKELHIAKGRGTPLKDIPNVAFKLSRRKTDDTLKLLHTVLFGRRGKAIQVKSNISRFSGFVWHENEGKQMIKVKEKLDKCNKEKLLEFCDVLDIQITRAAARKEDIITKLIDFLVAPQATTPVLLAEKLIKGKKRKRTANRPSGSATSSARAAKNRKKTEGSSVAEERKTTIDTEDESEEEGKDEELEKNDNGVPDKSEDEIPENSVSEEKGNSDNESEEVKKPRKTIKTLSSTKKESAAKSEIPQDTAITKPRSAPKRTSKKSSATCTAVEDDIEANPKVSSRKKDIEKRGKQKNSSLSKSSSKEKTGNVTKGKGKRKEKVNPSDEELHDAICKVLKEVDFNTATFTDILKQLAKQFDVDLTPRKASIKIIIQEELTKLADEADDEDDEDDEDAEDAEA